MYPTELHSNSKQCERFHLTYDQHNGRNKCSYPNMVVTRVCGSRTHFLIPLGRPTFLFSRFSVGSILIYPELDYKFKRTKICIIKLCCTTAHLKCSCWLRTLTFHKTSTPDPLQPFLLELFRRIQNTVVNLIRMTAQSESVTFTWSSEMKKKQKKKKHGHCCQLPITVSRTYVYLKITFWAFRCQNQDLIMKHPLAVD